MLFLIDNCGFGLGILSLVVSILALRFVLREQTINARLKASGIATEGVIVDRWNNERSGGSASYSVWFRFNVTEPGGDQVGVISKQSISRSNYNAMPVGTIVPVIYLASDPQKTARLTGSNADRTSYQTALIGTIGFFLVSIVLIVARLRS